MMTKITILDGGMGRELERIGAPFRQPEWSALALMEAPELVRQVHDDYIRAGAKVITTNSYAVVPFHIGEPRFRERGEELTGLAGRLAKEATTEAATGVKVAGSLPPVFGSYQPELFDPKLAAEYLGVLVRGMAPYVDLWLAETQSSIEEAAAAAAAVQSTGKPLWLSFTLRDDVSPQEMERSELRSKQSVVDAAAFAAQVGAEALLFNCSMPEVMAAALAAARAAAPSLPLGVYANAFGSQDNDGAANEVISLVRNDLDPHSYCSWVDGWINAGASIVGGCCGVGTNHIAQVAARFACQEIEQNS